MTDVNDPVRRLLEMLSRSLDGEYEVARDLGRITPDVARLWLRMPEQLQRARDTVRWRKASRELPDGAYVFALVGHGGAEVVAIFLGRVLYESGGWDAIDELPEQARFLGPLPEVPK